MNQREVEDHCNSVIVGMYVDFRNDMDQVIYSVDEHILFYLLQGSYITCSRLHNSLLVNHE